MTKEINLIGPSAFYTSPLYLESTKRDLESVKPLAPSYEIEFESRRKRLAKALFFPGYLHNLLHQKLATSFLLPSSNPANYPENYVWKARQKIDLTGEWKYRRFTVLVDGQAVDAMIVGRPETFGNKRWVLSANGNYSFYEERMGQEVPARSREFKQILTSLDANGLVFNYPGTGASSGSPSARSMAKAYKAMLKLLEEEKSGFGARVIVSFDHSIAGWSQTAGYNGHPLKAEIRYVAIKSRTFSSMPKTIEARVSRSLRPRLGVTLSKVAGKAMGLLAYVGDWNLRSTEATKRSKMPLIILQTASVSTPTELTSSLQIVHDGTLPEDAALAKELLDDPSFLKNRKVAIIGIPEGHNVHLTDTSFLNAKVKEFLGE